MQPRSARALARQTRKVEGWFLPDAASLFALIDEAQRSLGVSGDLFEIGVHHGKSATMLCAMASPSEGVGVCDLIAGQDGNASASGSGNREIFEANISAHPDGGRVRIFEKPSTDLTASELKGPYRFFHVDGGHLLAEALADIRLAASVLHEQGAIMVDDPFRPEWPGVTEAILRFCAERDDFVPLAVGFNKLVLVPSASRDAYEEFLLANVWSYVSRRVYARKTLPVAGTETHIFYIPARRQLPALVPAVARAGWLLQRLRRGIAGS